MSSKLLRTFSISKLEDYLRVEKSFRKNAPDKPIHVGVESLFSTESGFNNFRGMLNLVLILLSVASLRMVLENINNYGILADPLVLFRFFASDSAQWPAFILVIYLQIFILHALVIETLLARNWISQHHACLLKVVNLMVLLVHPSYIIWTSKITPLISAPILMVNTIVFLKLWSYGQVNNWCRARMIKKIKSLAGEVETMEPRIHLPETSSSNTTTSESSLHSSNCSLTSSSPPDASSTCEKCESNDLPTAASTPHSISRKNSIEEMVTSTVCEHHFPHAQPVQTEVKGKHGRHRGASHSHSKTHQHQSPSEKSNKRSTSARPSEVFHFQVGDAEVTVKQPRGGLYKKFNSTSGFVGTMRGLDRSMLKQEDQAFDWQKGLVFKNLDRKDCPKLYSIPTFVARLNVSYPMNLTLGDLYYFIFAPTLCYELNFPRTLSIRKKFLAKRIIELIALAQIGICLIQQWILPLLHKETQTFAQTRSSSVVLERILKFAIPNHIIWLLGFYVLFHSGLNVLAELTRFGDRLFYKDWWNAETVQNFWSTWNIPVHRWCRRHVYVPLLELGLSRSMAGLIVFFISAIFHEFLASVPLKMFRCWAFLGMMCQMPYAYLVHILSPGGGKLGNMAVWVTLIIGQPLAILMYLHDYYLLNYHLPTLTQAAENN